MSWLADADTLRYAELFGLAAPPASVSYLVGREDDLYLSLVGELFDYLREPVADEANWDALANAFAEFDYFREASRGGALPSDVALFAATAFYMGGFSASAYLTLRATDPEEATEGHVAAYELLARPPAPTSRHVVGLIGALRTGDTLLIDSELRAAESRASAALLDGPEEWVGWKLYRELLQRFARTNVRAVLPGGQAHFWDDLVRSFASRTPPVWDLFPSQIEAIQSGLLESDSTFSLQMPTGAGKTALTEIVVFSHLRRRPADIAVLLVPYRALAAELRGSLVRNLIAMGFNARAAYGGTVPTEEELDGAQNVNALVATPETLSGMLSAETDLLQRISLVICDEGHLLDGDARGVSLELLLARLRAREIGPPRFVFVSAIVPNIDEINAWLGGADNTVVRSDYRPALAEWARLNPVASDDHDEPSVTLRFHPHEPIAFDIKRFLSRDDFRYLRASTGRINNYSFDSVKTQAVAAARKALQMGAVAIFAANKRGAQGCVGLAEELLNQLSAPTSLPTPAQFTTSQARLREAVEYLALEYGSEWIGTKTLQAGAIVHHGDIPQEAREVLEGLVRGRVVRLALCTSTLAEGVNLPIRTMVLYSVRRLGPDGRGENLLTRDIKNLVGRAGRAGVSTRGLVICANPNQWSMVEPVALQTPGEPVEGALLVLMRALQSELVRTRLELTNELMENTTELYSLIDGVDATLIDLASEELEREELIALAARLAEETYAARGATTQTRALIRQVFELRADRIIGIRGEGRLGWLRETGARARMLDLVETGLLPARERWDDITSPLDDDLVRVLVSWAWNRRDTVRAFREASRNDAADEVQLQAFVSPWVAGHSLSEIAARTALSIDDALAVHARVVTYELQTAIEQGVAILGRLCAAQGRSLAPAVVAFPEHLRFGVPNAAGLVLAGVLRHRRAAVQLSLSRELVELGLDAREAILSTAASLLQDAERWLPVLGELVLSNSSFDLRRHSQAERED